MEKESWAICQESCLCCTHLESQKLHCKETWHDCFLKLTSNFSVNGSIYLFWERERASEQGRGRGRERIPCRPCAVSAEPDAGLDSTNCEIMIGAKIKNQRLNRLSHPGSPSSFPTQQSVFFFKFESDHIIVIHIILVFMYLGPNAKILTWPIRACRIWLLIHVMPLSFSSPHSTQGHLIPTSGALPMLFPLPTMFFTLVLQLSAENHFFRDG